jgi:hypothetical protein
MEQGGAPANFNRSGHGQRGFQLVPPRGAGQTEAFRGGFNRQHQGYGSGPYGRRGGVNRFQHRGRGFGAQPMSHRGGFEGFRHPQIGALPSQQQHGSGSGIPGNPTTLALNHDVATQRPRAAGIGQVEASEPIPLVQSAAQPNLIDISGLPTSAAGLLKQLLASMADKEVSKEESQMVSGAKLFFCEKSGAKLDEKEVMVLPERKHEVGESSA